MARVDTSYACTTTTYEHIVYDIYTGTIVPVRSYVHAHVYICIYDRIYKHAGRTLFAVFVITLYIIIMEFINYREGECIKFTSPNNASSITLGVIVVRT